MLAQRAVPRGKELPSLPIHREGLRVFAIAAIVLGLAFAEGTLNAAADPQPAGLRLALELAPRAAVSHAFLVRGVFEIETSAGRSVPLPDQDVVVLVDGAERGHATTNTQGRFETTLIAPATLGWHEASARAQLAGAPLAQSDPASFLVIGPPLAPAALRGAPGRHTGEISLAWDAPAFDETRPVDHWMIQRWDGAIWRGAGDAQADDRGFRDAGTSGATLRYRLVAQNFAGSSPPSPSVDVMAALPPFADALLIEATSVQACQDGACVDLAPGEFLITASASPVSLRARYHGSLANGSSPVDLEPWSGTATDVWNDQFSWHTVGPDALAGKTGSDGGFGSATAALVSPPPTGSQTCLEQAITLRAQYPGVPVVGAHAGVPDLHAQDTITVYLC